MSHSGDANKMVETPRTTDRVVFIDGNPWVNAPFARGLERELNAANERIKRLEEAGDRIIEAGWSVQDWSGMCVVWAKAKEDKP